ncbi:MAG: hypothetical protein KF713_00295 [Turneriella sp.]|nr:hypothetical protein [Turneriella sp.]
MIYLVAYLLILFAITFAVSHKETSEDFLIGGRNRAAWQVLLTKFAGTIGIGWFISYTGFAYVYGTSLFAALSGMIFGSLLFSLWAAPRIQKHAHEFKFYTQGDFVYHNTQSVFSKILVNSVSNIMQFLFLLISVVGGAKLISHFGFMPYAAAVATTSAAIAIYISLAGYKAVVMTDIFQSVIIISLLAFLTFTLLRSENINSLLASKTLKPDLPTIIGFWVYGIFGIFSGADAYQLCYAAKNRRATVAGLSLAMIPIMITGVFLLFVGLYMFTRAPGLDPDMIFMEAVMKHLPQVVVPLGVVLFFAGLMSSADTQVYAIASHLVLSTKTDQPVRKIRFTIVALLLVTAVIALVFRNIIGLTILGAAITLSLSVGMIYVVAGGKSADRFSGSVLGGLAAMGIGIAVFGLNPQIIGMVILGSLLGLLFKRSIPR